MSGYAAWDGVGDFEGVGVGVAMGLSREGRGTFLLGSGGGEVVDSEGVAWGDVDACR